jgi:diguanylate cyclase (GGDEF)-like protein
LVALARLISSKTRKLDHAVRWGGEEFAIICEKTSLKMALVVAESLRRVISAEPLIKDLSITCSFGVAELNNTESGLKKLTNTYMQPNTAVKIV